MIECDRHEGMGEREGRKYSIGGRNQTLRSGLSLNVMPAAW